MRIVVTGAAGMLGHALVPVLKADHQVIGLTIEDCDLCEKDAVRKIFLRHNPDTVIHLAAFTNVDACEFEPEKARAGNEIATLNVAEATREVGAALLYISTDYVFDGRLERPYREDDLPNPISVYGRSKLMGERHVQEVLDRYFIVRTSWLFGPNGKNFVTTILRLAGEKSEIRIVNDQQGSPTYTRHLSQKLAELVATRKYGVYHLTGGGNCTWFEFAKKILELCGLNGVQVIPISSQELDRPAPRPANSVLANGHAISLEIGPLPHWEKGLKDYLDEMQEPKNGAGGEYWENPADPKLA